MPRVSPAEAEISIYTYGKITPHQPGASYVIDVFGLRDPSSSSKYRNAYEDGRPGACQDYVKGDPRVEAILEQIKLLAHLHIQMGTDKWLSIGIRDHHGLWTSPAIGELAADMLARAGYKVSLFHYETKGEPKVIDIKPAVVM